MGAADGASTVGSSGRGHPYAQRPAGPELTPMTKLKAVLAQLTFNSKDIINDITRRAATLRGAETQVTSVIVNHILHTEPKHKLSCLYVIDSILKNVGGLYIPLLAAEMPDIYRACYPVVIPQEREKFKKVLRIWIDNPVPPRVSGGAVIGSISRREPLFPVEVIQEIEAVVRAVDEKRPIPPYESFKYLPAFNNVPTSATPNTEQRNRRDSGNISPVQQQQHQHQHQQHNNNNIDPRRAPQPTMDPRRAQMMQQHMQQQQHQNHHQNNPDISEENRQKEAIVKSILMDITKSIMKAETLLSSYPEAAQEVGLRDQITAFDGILKTLANNDTSILTESVLETLVEKARTFKDNLTVFESQQQQQQQQQSESQNADYMMDVTHDHNNHRSTSASNGMGVIEPDNALDIPIIDFTKDSLLKPRKASIWLFYGALDIKCKQCSMRYRRDDTGSAKMSLHLDWHFRQNKKAKSKASGAATIGTIREWFMNEDDWVKEVDDEILLAKNGESQQDSATAENRKNTANMFFETGLNGSQSGLNGGTDMTKINLNLLDIDERAKLKKQLATRSKIGIVKIGDLNASDDLGGNNSSIGTNSNKMTTSNTDEDYLQNLSEDKRQEILEMGNIKIRPDMNDQTCSICMEHLTKFYDENKEAWVLRDVVRTEEGIFHKSCYLDQ